jgi:trigger factor
MDIQIETTHAEGTERRIKVSVPAAVVTAAADQVTRRYASQARLPGFRAGKAPAAMVRKKFADVIRAEALEGVLRDAYQAVLERERLEPAGEPHAHAVHYHEGEPLTFELHLEVRPSITLARTEGFRVTRPAATVTEEMVTAQLDQLRDQRAAWTPVDGKPQEGDLVALALATPEPDGTMPAGRDYSVVLGGGQVIPGIEELVMALAPGDAVEQPVRWPDDFPDEAQRGVTKPVRVRLKEVKRKALPALDDAFAREAGDFDSLPALRAAVRDDLARAAARDAEAAVRQALLEEVIGANPFDVPRAWVLRLVGAYADAYQVPAEERPRFAQEFAAVAERQVRRDLVIDTLAQREGLTATEADVDAKVAELAQARGVAVGTLYTTLEKAGRLREIERGVTEDRVFAWLAARNTVQSA